MDENKLTTLAFSMHSNKGVYALFLGSGVSLSAGIPTGWQIVQDLTRKLANMSSDTNVVDSVEWYRHKYSKNADYSDLLGKLAITSSERKGLMEPYFTPNAEEAGNGLKQPTAAHRAIAKLMQLGYVKVVVTTNFDQLLEKALSEINLTPQVIRTEADIEGATPLVHADCTIVKINGDFMDCRFKNTIEELTDYSEVWKAYLSRIFEDFGIITCGWSAKWDKALVELLKAKLNQRYNSTFTGKEGADNLELKELATFKHATLLEIDDADSFFGSLVDKVEALEYVNRNTSLSADIAVARVKKYISSSNGIIQLSDLFEDEVKNVISILQRKNPMSEQPTKQLIQDMKEIAVQAAEVYLPMLECAIRWCKPEHEKIILDSLENIINRDMENPSNNLNEVSYTLNYLAAAMYFYAAGILCIRYEKFALLNAIFNIQLISTGVTYCNNFQNGPIVQCFNCWMNDRRSVLSNQMYPLSMIAFKQLQKLLPHKKYKVQFYIFEKLLCLYYVMLVDCNQNVDEPRNLPEGLYLFQYSNTTKGSTYDLYNQFFNKIDTLKDNSPVIQKGLFDGSYKTYHSLIEKFNAFWTKNPPTGF